MPTFFLFRTAVCEGRDPGLKHEILMKTFEAQLRLIPQRNALKLWIPAGVYPRAGGDGDDEEIGGRARFRDDEKFIRRQQWDQARNDSVFMYTPR